MPRYKLTIEYDGRAFHGWQIQDGYVTVQEAIQQAFSKLTKETVDIIGAGRTDAGVHALGQVAHVDLSRGYTPQEITGALNYYLKDKGVVILKAEEVDETFHARFSATARQYVYKIINRQMPLTLDVGRAWHIRYPLNVEAMKEAASYLLGHHDFSTFRSLQCQATLVERTVKLLTVDQHDDWILIHIQSKAFLRNQVRIIVGTLKLVGEEKWSPLQVKEALEARDRTKAGPTAPPEGLYFAKVCY